MTRPAMSSGMLEASLYALCVDRGLSAASQAVGAILIDDAHQHDGRCTLDIATIVRLTDLHRATVFRALHRLQERGYIIRREGGISWRGLQVQDTLIARRS